MGIIWLLGESVEGNETDMEGKSILERILHVKRKRDREWGWEREGEGETTIVSVRYYSFFSLFEIPTKPQKDDK